MSLRRLSIASAKAGVSPLRQDLSPKAAKAKADRDLAYAKTDRRSSMKAENQRHKRAAVKAGVSTAGKDYDHKRQKYVSVASNRGNEGKGTKSEG